MILTGYQVPNGVKILGNSAFLGDERLQSISIPSSVEIIDSYCFDECIKLADVSFDNGVQVLNNNAFTGCIGLSRIVIPGSVEKIGDGCFSDCTRLSSIQLTEGLRSIGKAAFQNCIFTTISIPDSTESIGINPFKGCQYLEVIETSMNNTHYLIQSNALFTADQKKLICYPAGISDSQYSIPQGTEIIGASSFYSCDNLEKIEIPDTVTTIEDLAYAFCDSLREINIPSSVTEIGDRIFLSCDALINVDVQRNSIAAQYCEVSAIPYSYPDSNDWLND